MKKIITIRFQLYLRGLSIRELFFVGDGVWAQDKFSACKAAERGKYKTSLGEANAVR